MRRTSLMFAAAGLTAIATIAAPRTAHAGIMDFGWVYDTSTLPERGVELQQWISEENHEGAARTSATYVQWGPVVGITDQLELTLPVDFVWSGSDGQPPTFTFDWYRLEARYRFVTSDPVEAPAIVPLVRLAVDRNVLDRSSVHAESDVVVSWTHDAIHAVVDVGVVADFNNADGDGARENRFLLHPGGGVSVKLTDELRVGGELFGQVKLANSLDSNWLALGPDLSWVHGRFWLTGTFGIGLTGMGTAPRVIWGVAF